MNRQADAIPRDSNAAPLLAHTLFPTALGTCGLAWNESGLTRFLLPETPDDGLKPKNDKRTTRNREYTPRPQWVRRLVERVQKHLERYPQDFSDVPLDWSQVSDFQQAVYRQVRTINPGEKLSYGDVARLVGSGPQAARGVGVALASNPWPLIIPCHRIVSVRGKMTGYSGPGGIRTKTRLLVLEGAELLSE